MSDAFAVQVDARVLSNEVASDPEQPRPVDLGQPANYAPGSPDGVRSLVGWLQSIADHLLEDANELDGNLSTAQRIGWTGAFSRQFLNVVSPLPSLLRGQTIPILQDAIDRLRRFAAELDRLQADARSKLATAQPKEHERASIATRKRSGGLNPAQNSQLTSQITDCKNVVLTALSQLDQIRNEKHQMSVSLGSNLESSSLELRSVAGQIVQTVHSSLPDASIATGAAGIAGSTNGVTTGIPDVQQVGVAGDGATVSVVGVSVGGSAPVPAGNANLPHRPDGQFPVGAATDLGGLGPLSGSDSPALGAAAVLAVGGVGAGAVLSRSGSGSGSAADASPAAAGSGAAETQTGGDPQNAGGTAVTVAGAAVGAENHHHIGLGLPTLTVAAGTAVGLLVAAGGGAFRRDLGDAGAGAGGQRLDPLTRQGCSLLPGGAVESLRGDLARRRQEELDGGVPGAVESVSLPGGLTMDIPRGWAVVADERCAVLTPGGTGAFASNIVVVVDPTRAVDPLFGVDAFRGNLAFESDILTGAQPGTRARFGYACETTPVTVHRYLLDKSKSGTVVVTASVAASRVDVDGHVVDKMLASARLD